MIRHVPRFFVGSILIITGIAKMIDLHGFVNVVLSYQMVTGASATAVGYLLPTIEMILGLWLFSGYKLPIAGWLAVVIHFFYFSVAGITLWRGLDVPNCGCFGVFYPRPLGINTLFEDAIMIFIALLVVLCSHRISEITVKYK